MARRGCQCEYDPNITATLYIDDMLLVRAVNRVKSTTLPNIDPIEFSRLNGTQSPSGSVPFQFPPAALHKVRQELQVWNCEQKIENSRRVNAQVELFWNLVDLKELIEMVMLTIESGTNINI